MSPPNSVPAPVPPVPEAPPPAIAPAPPLPPVPAATLPEGALPAPPDPFSVCPWRSWADVPESPPVWAMAHAWAVEIFAGSAGVHASLVADGFFCLPPVENDIPNGFPAADAFDSSVLAKLLGWISAGALRLIHFGTPCSSFSIARDDDPLRSLHFPLGLPDLSPSQQAKVDLANRCVDVTIQLASAVWQPGGHWTIENPTSSLIWEVPTLRTLLDACSAFPVFLAMCCYGSVYGKPTTIWATHRAFLDLARVCPGVSATHHHARLRGRCRHPASGRWVWRTSLAAAYPPLFCRSYSLAVAESRTPFRWRRPQPLPPRCDDGVSQFSDAFAILHHGSRKRPLGSDVPVRASTRRRSGSAAVDAGYQLRMATVPPLITTEVDEGEAIRLAMTAKHPFSVAPEMPPVIEDILSSLQADWGAVNRLRSDRIQFWARRALDLRSQSIAEINAITDPHLRNLLFLNITVSDDQRQVGQFVHLALWREIARSAGAGDAKYVDEFASGFEVVGDIARSGVWDEQFDEAKISVEELGTRAWEFRSRVDSRVMRRAGGDFPDQAMAASISDVEAGFSLGPFYSHDAVSNELGCDDWMSTERFAIEQKGKIRNIDSAVQLNEAATITEHLDIATTDGNVALLRRLRQVLPDHPISGWILDEKDAYRWVPIHPSHRKYSVIATFDPKKSTVAYFIMVGHPFGFKSSVYNYNRRSLLLNTILRREFRCLSAFYYDDKFGFEPSVTCRSSMACAILLHQWVGAVFNPVKLDFGEVLKILGVRYDLPRNIISITDERRTQILSSIQSIFSSGKLGSGLAGKLRGQLGFAASQFWGKVGRAFFRSLSERQYDKSGKSDLNPEIAISLRQWVRILVSGRPREIASICPKPADVVIFTDGFFPNPILKEVGTPMVGGVIFVRTWSKPVVFSMPIEVGMMEHWIPRLTQVAMIEMFAPVLALEFLNEAIAGKSVTIMVDSESVEGALVKGYSRRSDMCELTSVFWDLADRLKLETYIDRVSTDANIADGPSRDYPDFWEMSNRLGWVRLETWVPDYLDPERSIKGLGR